MHRLALALAGALVACSSQAPPSRTAKPVVEPRPVVSQPVIRPLEEQEARPARSTPSPRSNSASTSAAAIAEASDLAKRGNEAYKLGRYDEAESLLKRSITVYPFLAQANLGLGKVFLLRGAAAHDEALVDSARLMFQMAQKNDPSLREPEILLQLFQP
ncbi:MAG: tetratricopeptide repeat protein [Clostridia bacterium]|nr:tetratricopeptide repeat protein [Deltaproteobacteria bacterium]